MYFFLEVPARDLGWLHLVRNRGEMGTFGWVEEKRVLCNNRLARVVITMLCAEIYSLLFQPGMTDHSDFKASTGASSKEEQVYACDSSQAPFSLPPPAICQHTRSLMRGFTVTPAWNSTLKILFVVFLSKN